MIIILDSSACGGQSKVVVWNLRPVKQCHYGSKHLLYYLLSNCGDWQRLAQSSWCSRNHGLVFLLASGLSFNRTGVDQNTRASILVPLANKTHGPSFMRKRNSFIERFLFPMFDSNSQWTGLWWCSREA